MEPFQTTPRRNLLLPGAVSPKAVSVLRLVCSSIYPTTAPVSVPWLSLCTNLLNTFCKILLFFFFKNVLTAKKNNYSYRTLFFLSSFFGEPNNFICSTHTNVNHSPPPYPFALLFFPPSSLSPLLCGACQMPWSYLIAEEKCSDRANTR